VQQKTSENSVLDRLADDSGLAIAVVDASSSEIFTTNNNSICKTLNPTGHFAGACADFCGTVFEECAGHGGRSVFTCHAGLECRAVALRNNERPVVAIVGRTFIEADNYRRATERAITGDWNQYPPAALFENILLTGSLSLLDETASKVVEQYSKAGGEKAEKDRLNAAEPIVEVASDMTNESAAANKIVEQFNRDVGLPSAKSESVAVVEPAKLETAATPQQSDQRLAQARAWRSFFGSLLQTDYPGAARSILAFIAAQYGFNALMWLEKNKNLLEIALTHGEMKGRKVRLGISTDDARLIDAAQQERPLAIAERPSETSEKKRRTMLLFPIGLEGKISAGIAILDKIDDEAVKKQIARICQSIAPQLEILRLRNAVERGENMAEAIRRFGENLRLAETDDLWLALTQNAAEMLRAERASLLIHNDRADKLEIKAMVGSQFAIAADETPGLRVAKTVFAKAKPAIIADVSKTGLPATDRSYKTGSFLSCPILIGNQAIGVMNFTDKVTGLPFDRSSLALFQAIAPQLAVAVDRASLKEKANEFEQLSVTDALTGLLNRRYIEARLLEEVKRSNRHGFPMSFMMIDVDHFKSYNDAFGHPAGDEALRMVGNVIRETLRGADVAARFGGEEFAILLPQTTGDEAEAIAERIRRNIEESNFPHRRVTISVGVASCSADLCAAPDIVKAADDAAYEAKRNGRNRVVTFEEMTMPKAD